MWLTADATDDTISFPIVGVLLMVSFFVFMAGYTVAVVRRANKDYKTTKAAVPNLRKGFWASWRRAAKFVVFIAVVGFILVAWVVNDFKDAYPPATPASVTSSPTGR